MTPPSSPAPRAPLLRMTLDQYGDAVRAAYEAGYMEGGLHPKGATPAKGKMLATVFWTCVASRFLDKSAPPRAPLEGV